MIPIRIEILTCQSVALDVGSLSQGWVSCLKLVVFIVVYSRGGSLLQPFLPFNADAVINDIRVAGNELAVYGDRHLTWLNRKGL